MGFINSSDAQRVYGSTTTTRALKRKSNQPFIVESGDVYETSTPLGRICQITPSVDNPERIATEQYDGFYIQALEFSGGEWNTLGAFFSGISIPPNQYNTLVKSNIPNQIFYKHGTSFNFNVLEFDNLLLTWSLVAAFTNTNVDNGISPLQFNNQYIGTTTLTSFPDRTLVRNYSYTKPSTFVQNGSTYTYNINPTGIDGNYRQPVVFGISDVLFPVYKSDPLQSVQALHWDGVSGTFSLLGTEFFIFPYSLSAPPDILNNVTVGTRNPSQVVFLQLIGSTWEVRDVLDLPTGEILIDVTMYNPFLPGSPDTRVLVVCTLMAGIYRLRRYLINY